jgi:putative nucleotidyltransferase with HDIG domain
MPVIAPLPRACPPPLDARIIETRLKDCPRLPSLGSVNSALRELLHADQGYTSQIAEVIRRDPSLTARLLRVVNSVYFGLQTRVNSIEDAIFYLGVRQIRQLSMMTPVIEDFHKLAGRTPFPWREFWQHCIGTAVLTREVISCVESPEDETAYVAGLVHDVGKIVMVATFPDHFIEIQKRVRELGAPLLDTERLVLGMGHDDVGAAYLRHHGLPGVMVEVAQFHHHPEHASHHARTVAAVQIADLMIRHAGIGDSGHLQRPTAEDWMECSGWKILFPSQDPAELAFSHATFRRALDRLPTLLEGLV